MRSKDILGNKYGRLIVTKFCFVRNESAYWECLCLCGKKIITKGYSLRSGGTKSCGCLHSDMAKKRQKITCFKHGKTGTKVYIAFKQIQARCYNKNEKSYKNYGGRGVRCEWKTFEEFYKDMGEPLSKDYSIDRINNNGSYSKKNCRWATKREQALNRRTAHLLTYEGKTKNMKIWATELKIPNRTLWWRIKAGWTVERAFGKI